ncbi:hypothetical protein M404DRAFT_155617, partial [Pisolithus tinctorius Marx 270]
PVSLAAGEYFRGRKVLKILVVSNNINWRGQALKVVTPGLECFKNCKQFLIMGVIIQLQGHQSPGVESDQMYLAIATGDREDAGDGIVQHISLNSDRDPGDEMKVPRSPFVGKLSQWYDNVQVIKDKPAVEVSEAEEGLYVFDLARLGPIADGLDLFLRHSEASRGEVESEVFD